jgi:hypothetical protein
MPDDAPVGVVYLRPTQPSAQVERVALIGGLIARVTLDKISERWLIADFDHY